MEKFKNFAHKAQLIYFSDKGESMSDAQNMKGKCNQVSEDVRSHFASIGPVKEIVHYDNKEINLTVPVVLEAKKIAEIVGKDAEANALNGWYARAIKAKNDLMNNIRTANWTMFLNEGEDFTPEKYDVKFDVDQPHAIQYDEEDILGEWSANEVADFLIKEQYCVTVGKLIHKKGKLHSIYNSPLTETTRFHDLNSGNGGTKAYPVTITPVYQGKELNAIKKMYLKNHDDHREAEKKVNWYKAKIKNELTIKNAAAQREYADAMGDFSKKQADYNDTRKSFMDKVRNANEKLRAECEARRELLVKDASAMKIFIPENLRDTKKFVQNYAAID